MMSSSPLCVMIGPGPQSQGGIASVVRVYAEAGLFADGEVCMLPSFSEGGKTHKLGVAALALLQYAGLLMRGKGAVLHIHVASDASFWRKSIFIWMASLARRKIIFHLHSGGFGRFIDNLAGWQRRYAIATIRRSSQLLCLSTPAQNWLKQIAPELPLRLWPNPVPACLFEDNEDHMAREPVVLFLGALLPAKGVAELLQAFATLHAADPSAQLVLAGSGPDLAALQAQAAELHIQDNVHFPGWIDAQEKAGWLRQARVLTLASHVEGQPMVLLEAMASGTAVLSTTVGGIPDLIEHGVHGLLVPAHDTAALTAELLRLWDDEALRKRLIQAARAHVSERHHALQVNTALIQLYRQLATPAAAPP